MTTETDMALNTARSAKPMLFKAAKSKDGVSRKPVLLFGDGAVETVKLTPFRNGWIAGWQGHVLYFSPWPKRDSGFPKLRWQ